MINDLMIKSFLALTDTLNFTNAAKRLYLSQQAVSKHIAKLEDELECQLFFRSRGDISLTPAGKIYFNVFSQYIDNMANATILVRNMTGAAKHKLIIGHLEMLDIRLTLSSVVQKLNWSTVPSKIMNCPRHFMTTASIWQSRSDRRFSLISL